MYSHVWTAFWIAFGASAVLAWPTIVFLKKLGAGSRISPYLPETHLKKEGTPNMGGLFVLGGVVLALLYASATGRLSVAALLVLITGFALIGLLDDYVVPRTSSRRGLGWLPKLILQVMVVAVFCYLFSFSRWCLVAGFFILFFANAVNFADGLDALAASLVIIALVPFAVFFAGAEGMNLINQGIDLSIVCVSMIGALLPFIVVNSPPAFVFMGDLGALSLGAVYGYVFSQSPWQNAAWPWVTSVILIVELVMVPMQIAAVKTLGRRIFPATPMHHGFEKIGWPESRVLWVMVAVQIALSAFALSEVVS